MTFSEPFTSRRAERRLALAVLVAALVFGGCFGAGESFFEPDCDTPVDVLEPEDSTSGADSIRTPNPAPNPDFNPCPAPNV